MNTFGVGRPRHGAVRRHAWMRRWRALAALPMLAVVWVPGCQTPGPQAGQMTVVTTNRPTPIKLEGFNNKDFTPVRFSLSAPWAANGTVTGDGQQHVNYTPRPDYHGNDAFGFTVTAQDGRTSSATVSVVVKRPNIVVVMTDDQTAEEQRFMTRTNALIGAPGTTFSDMVVSYSECCPSRSTFLTGQYAHNHGVVSSAPPTGGVGEFTKKDGDTLVTRLKAAGYHTSLVGKYLNYYGDPDPLRNGIGSGEAVTLSNYVPPGWSDWFALIEPTGYNFYNYNVSDNGTVKHFGTGPDNYSTDVVFGRAEQNIKAQGGGATPLFLFVTPTAPHSVWGERPPEEEKPAPSPIPADRHKGRFAGERAPRNAATDLPANSNVPVWPEPFPVTAANRPNIDAMYRVAAESLLAVDEGVERLVAALKEKGELDNTLFVYTSDNGYHYGDHGRMMGKSDQYDETLRVPLLVRGPGFPVGYTARQPVANIDLAPTLAAVAGVDLGRVADGVPLTRFTADPTFGAKRTVVIENGPAAGRTRVYAGIRDDRWKFVETNLNGQIIFELYDRLNDPYETRNLYGEPAAALAQYSGRSRLIQLLTCAGAACHLGLPVNATPP